MSFFEAVGILFCGIIGFCVVVMFAEGIITLIQDSSRNKLMKEINSRDNEIERLRKLLEERNAPVENDGEKEDAE